MKGRYSLQSLRQIRKQALEERSLEVARASTRVATAKETLATRRGLARREREQQAQILAREQQRLTRGAACANDLHEVSAWQVAARLQLQELEVRVNEAEAELRRAEEARSRAREALAIAEAEKSAVDKHHEHWQTEEAALREANADEEGQEIWGSRQLEVRG